MDEAWKVISASTRKQAMDAGGVTEGTAAAKAMGDPVNTHVTDHLFYDAVTSPAGLEGEGQATEERRQDLLFAR